MPITTVIFDLGGVLVQTLWERVTEPVSRMNGMSPGEVMDQIRTGDAYFPHMSGEIDKNIHFQIHMMRLEWIFLSINPRCVYHNPLPNV